MNFYDFYDKTSSDFFKIIIPKLNVVLTEEWNSCFTIYYQDKCSLEKLRSFIDKANLFHLSQSKNIDEIWQKNYLEYYTKGWKADFKKEKGATNYTKIIASKNGEIVKKESKQVDNYMPTAIQKVKFSQIFNDTIALYPEYIYIGDGNSISKKDVLFYYLNDIYNIISKEEYYLQDEIYAQMSWVIITYLHQLAIKKFRKNKKFIYKYDIDLNSVHKRFYNDYIEKKHSAYGDKW